MKKVFVFLGIFVLLIEIGCKSSVNPTGNATKSENSDLGTRETDLLKYRYPDQTEKEMVKVDRGIVDENSASIEEATTQELISATEEESDESTEMDEGEALAASSASKTMSVAQSASKLPAIPNFPSISWKRSLFSGGPNELPTANSGNLPGGTEIRAIENFEGKLYASNGYWTDKYLKDVCNVENVPGAQVMVLDESTGKWTVDLHLDERLPGAADARPASCPVKPGCTAKSTSAACKTNQRQRRFIAVSNMKSLSFKTDSNGIKLEKPANFLVGSVWDKLNGLTLIVRDSKGWRIDRVIPADNSDRKASSIRSIRLFNDPETGVDTVFLGSSGDVGIPPAIYTGMYDKKTERIVWNSQSERWATSPGRYDRVMSFGVMYGDLYAAVCNKIYRRSYAQDKNRAEWVMVHLQKNHSIIATINNLGPNQGCGAATGEMGFRGMIKIPRRLENGETEESLLTPLETTGIYRRLYVRKTQNEYKYSMKTEFNLNAKLQSLFAWPVYYSISSYNDTTPVTFNTRTERGDVTVLFSGTESALSVTGTDAPSLPGVHWHGWGSHARYVIRYYKNRYEVRTIVDPERPNDVLLAVRGFIPSPTKANRVYAWGYDGNGIYENHNTGWIMVGDY